MHSFILLYRSQRSSKLVFQLLLFNNSFLEDRSKKRFLITVFLRQRKICEPYMMWFILKLPVMYCLEYFFVLKQRSPDICFNAIWEEIRKKYFSNLYHYLYIDWYRKFSQLLELFRISDRKRKSKLRKEKIMLKRLSNFAYKIHGCLQNIFTLVRVMLKFSQHLKVIITTIFQRHFWLFLSEL